MRFPYGTNVRRRDGFRICRTSSRRAAAALAAPVLAPVPSRRSLLYALPMEMLVPLMIGLTLIWLIGRGTPWNAKLLTLAVTLAVILFIVLLERGGYWPESWQRR
jgi:hypothetical protein